MCTRWYSGKLPAAQPACQPAQRDTSPQASRASSSSSTSTSLIPSASLTLSSPQRLHHHRRCPNALTAAQLHNGLPQGHAPCRPQCVPPPYRRCSLLSPGHRRRLPRPSPRSRALTLCCSRPIHRAGQGQVGWRHVEYAAYWPCACSARPLTPVQAQWQARCPWPPYVSPSRLHSTSSAVVL
jgi:hypothetical protein